MAKKTPYRSKRNRSDSVSSTSSNSPTQNPKKSRISDNSTTSKPNSRSLKKNSPSSDKQVKEGDQTENHDSNEPESSQSSLSDHNDPKEDHLSNKQSTSGRSKNSTSAPSQINDNSAFIAFLQGMDPQQLQQLLLSSSSSSIPRGIEVPAIPESEGGQKQEMEIDSKIKHTWENIVEGWEDESEGEEDEGALEDKADKLAEALAGPFERFKAHSITSLQEVNYTINQALQTALDPFKGDLILKQLKIWRERQVKLARETEEKWDHAAAFVADRKTRMDAIMEQIQAINENRKQLIEQFKKDSEEALTRHEAEIEGFKEELVKGKEKYRNKIIKATDKDRINKEVNMTMTKLLSQFNT